MRVHGDCKVASPAIDAPPELFRGRVAFGPTHVSMAIVVSPTRLPSLSVPTT